MDPAEEPKVGGEGDVEDSAQLEAKQLGELQASRNELLNRVQNLKKDLQDWRVKLDSQVKGYRTELGELRSTLNNEVEQLRAEFAELRKTLKDQLEQTVQLSNPDPDDEQ
eukprot:jgi/Mesvir1/2310/Mv19343-RA.1